jgi:hypothetical protein
VGGDNGPAVLVAKAKSFYVLSVEFGKTLDYTFELQLYR